MFKWLFGIKLKFGSGYTKEKFHKTPLNFVHSRDRMKVFFDDREKRKEVAKLKKEAEE